MTSKASQTEDALEPDAAAEAAQVPDAGPAGEPDSAAEAALDRDRDAVDPTVEPDDPDGALEPSEDLHGSAEAEAARAEAPRAEASDEQPRRRFRIAWDDRIVAVVVLLALTASIVTAALLYRSWNAAEDELAEEKQVRTRSAEYAQLFFGYKHGDLKGWQQRLTDLSSKDYGTAIGGALGELPKMITEMKADSSAVIRDVFVNEIDGNLAKTIVVADTEVRSTQSINTKQGLKMLLELKKEKGVWLVSGLGVLGSDGERATDPQGRPLEPEAAGVPTAKP